MPTYKNNGGKTRITFANGRAPVVVLEGGTYTTTDPEEQTALRKSGQFVVERGSASAEKRKEKD